MKGGVYRMLTNIAAKQEKENHKYNIQDGQNPPEHLPRLRFDFFPYALERISFAHGTVAKPSNG